MNWINELTYPAYTTYQEASNIVRKMKNISEPLLFVDIFREFIRDTQ
jgi:hypothetical protein